MGFLTPLAGVFFADDLKALGSSKYRFVIASDAVSVEAHQDGSTLGVIDISPVGSWVETECRNKGIPYKRLARRSKKSAKAWICRNILPRLEPESISFID